MSLYIEAEMEQCLYFQQSLQPAVMVEGVGRYTPDQWAMGSPPA